MRTRLPHRARHASGCSVAARHPQPAQPQSPCGPSPAASGVYYICGPEQFMADVARRSTDIGLESAAVHTELFGALGEIGPRTPHRRRGRRRTPPRGEPGTRQSVTLPRSGLTTPWNTATARHPCSEFTDIPEAQVVVRGTSHVPHLRHPAAHRQNRLPARTIDPRPPAMCWSAAHARPPISSSTCDATGPPRTGCAIAGTPTPPRIAKPQRAGRRRIHDGGLAPLVFRAIGVHRVTEVWPTLKSDRLSSILPHGQRKHW